MPMTVESVKVTTNESTVFWIAFQNTGSVNTRA